MKKLLLLLLLATALFWALGRHTQTATPDRGSSFATLPVTTNARDIVEPVIAGATMNYYSVSGNTPQALRDDLNRQHPVNNFDGHTAWNVSWSWPGFATADCDLGAATLGTKITVSLPRWSPPDHADPALTLQWQRYLGSLARHEQGHVERAQQGFEKMQSILRHSNCLDADAALNVVLGEMREADLHYDAETSHGVSQGAQFP